MSDMCEDNINMSVNEESKVIAPEVKTLNVNVNLLTNIRSLLEISTQRGTFKANEFSSVGKVYDELLVLLK
mgnify:FL=1|tara:strand:+ start:203 stop:415 length:213 start_codon:yes stop_codon:yes gene_type:complete